MVDNKNFKDKPLQLVSIKEDGLFEITSDGIGFLSNLKDSKLAVLSITGPYRSGKSFLANLIMDKMSGFKVGSTINACTKGLWAWGRPITLANGRKLLIIDSEGMGSVEKDRTHNIDMKIFTLSVLLSSCIIYNTKYAISEDKIEELSNVANISKRINISKDSSNLDYGDYFPELIWILRDFSLDKGSLTAKDYLEQCLRNVDTEVIEGGETKNISREIITRNFKSRDCYTLVMPSTDEIKLRNLENENQSTLRPEFINQVEAMISNIKATIQPKRINHVELDGEALFGLLQTYIESINNEENPVILSALENVLLSKAKNISENNFEKFKNEINSKLEDKYPVSFQEIYNLFFESQNSLISNFCTDINDTLNSNQIGEYILRLFSRMKNELELIIETSSSTFEEVVNSKYALIVKNIKLKQIEKIEDSKLFFLNISNQFQSSLSKFIEMTTNETDKKIVSLVISFIQEQLLDFLRKAGTAIEEKYSSTVNDYNLEIEDLNLKIKGLTDAIFQEKKITELKDKELSDTKIRIYEIESKHDSLKRKNKEKEKEYMNNMNTELQKYQKMENSYIVLLQEKDSKISFLQTQLNQLNSHSSMQSQELSKENLKLMYELKKAKESGHKSSGGNVDVYDSTSINLQSLFKTFQENMLTFKENVNKLDQSKENLFKDKYLEKCKEEIETKTRHWGNEIVSMIKKQIETISNNYDINIKKNEEEIAKLNKEIDRLQDENLNKEKYKINYEGEKRKVKELMDIRNSKDAIIATQLQDIKIKEDQINEIKKQKESREIELSEFITKYHIIGEELEQVLSAIEGIFSKKKDKYEMHFNYMSQEMQERFTQFNKKYKFKF